MTTATATTADHEHLVGRRLLRPAEVAHTLGLSRTLVYGMIRSGQIPSIAFGRARRVPVAALEQWIADRTASAATQPGTGGYGDA